MKPGQITDRCAFGDLSWPPDVAITWETLARDLQGNARAYAKREETAVIGEWLTRMAAVAHRVAQGGPLPDPDPEETP